MDLNPAEAETAIPMARRLSALGARFGVLIALVFIFILFTLLLPGRFASSGDILAMLNSEAPIVILGLGITLTLRLGDLDVSFAATMNLSAILVALLTANHHVPVPLAILCGVAVGGLVGLLNALLVVGIGLNGFVATLGVMIALEGVGYGLSGSQTIIGVPNGMISFATKTLGTIPLQVYYGWVLVVLLWIVYERTVFGRYLLFVGGNRRAARLMGIRTSRVRWTAYVVSGLCFGFAGAVLTGSIGAADPTLAAQFLLPPLAGAFVGSTTIQPGRFNAIGTLLGLYLLMVVSSGLQLLGAASWVSSVFEGVALVAAVGFARLTGSGLASQEF